MDRKCPLSHTGTELSPNITEALWEGARLAPSLHLWDNRFLLLSCFQVHPTVSRVDQTVAERKRENYCMHLDNLAPLSQC